MDNFLEGVATIVGVFALAGLLLLVGPFISFWLAYFGGWLAKITIGDTLCQALNTLFPTRTFVKDLIPWYAGALGWIGGFFKAATYNRNSKHN